MTRWLHLRRYLITATMVAVSAVSIYYSAATLAAVKSETIKGQLEVVAECDGHTSRTLYFVNTANERLELKFVSKPSEELHTGMNISVKGSRRGDSLTAESASVVATETESLAANTATPAPSALASTTGEQRVLVILVNFQDKMTQPFTVDQARDVTFNQTSNYMRESSYGQTWMTGDVFGWYTIPMNSTSCDTTAIATYAKDAAVKAGAVLSNYGHYIYGFPQNSGCGFTGRGSVGGSPSEAWINQYFDINAVGHEFGHNLGLYHSSSMDCGAQAIGSTCTVSETGDVYDIMGGGASAHMNLYQKERLGWAGGAASPPLQTITSSGTYFIDAYETLGSNAKGLKVLRSVDPVTGVRSWYYVEHRTPTGYDSYLSTNSAYNVINGVSIHLGNESYSGDNYLLDMTPATASWYDSGLLPGSVFTDGVTGISFTTLSADSTGAWVQVDLPAQACSRSNPSVTLTPGQTQWLTSGATFNYSVTVKNNDGSGCASSAFDLQQSIPSGWGASYSAASMNLAPGQSGTTTLSVTSPSGTADGSYGVTATASRTGYVGTSTAAYLIVSQLGVTAVSSASTYTRTQTVKITANVRAGGSPTAGASVAFTMTKPNGTVVSGTGVSDANGNTVFQYALNRKVDLTGNYTVQVRASSNGYSGSGTVAFKVK